MSKRILTTRLWTIRSKNEIKTIKFENQKIKTKVNPYKEDRDTKEPLAGAEFDIYKDINENGKLDDEDKIIYHTITKEDGYSEGVYRKVCVNFRLFMIIF